MALEEAWLLLKGGAPPPAWTKPANQTIQWFNPDTGENETTIETNPGLDRMADNIEADRLEARSRKTQEGLDAMKRPGFLEGLTSAGRKRWKDWFNTQMEGHWKVGDDRVQARRVRGTAPDWRKDRDESHARVRDLPSLYATEGNRGVTRINPGWTASRTIEQQPDWGTGHWGLAAQGSPSVVGDGMTTDEPASTFAEEYPNRQESAISRYEQGQSGY